VTDLKGQKEDRQRKDREKTGRQGGIQVGDSIRKRDKLESEKGRMNIRVKQKEGQMEERGEGPSHKTGDILPHM